MELIKPVLEVYSVSVIDSARFHFTAGQRRLPAQLLTDRQTFWQLHQVSEYDIGT